jgi:putative transposase
MYFFTSVTHRRQPFLTNETARICLRQAIKKVREKHPFQIVAIVLLPDHWHSVWQLPDGETDYPLRWSRIKEEFTERWIAAGGCELPQSASRKRQRYRGIWQKRYWEHTIRDENDLERCVDYIHWNPRKHNLVSQVADWKWSSFHRMVRKGQYSADWGGTDPTPGWNEPEWGE